MLSNESSGYAATSLLIIGDRADAVRPQRGHVADDLVDHRLDVRAMVADEHHDDAVGARGRRRANGCRRRRREARRARQLCRDGRGASSGWPWCPRGQVYARLCQNRSTFHTGESSMRVIRHTDPDAFLAAAAPISARGEASASFFVGWAHSLKRTSPRGGRARLPCDLRGRRRPAAWRCSATRVRRSSGRATPPRQSRLPKISRATGLCCKASSGRSTESEAFAWRWHELTGRGHVLRRGCVCASMCCMTSPSRTGGSGRPAPGDALATFPWLIEMQNAFIVEVGIPDSPERIREGRWANASSAAISGSGTTMRQWPMSASTTRRPNSRALRRSIRCPIGAGGGYATALVAALLRENCPLAARRKLFLTTDLANPTSNAIYARIGFRPENDDCHFDFVAAPAPATPALRHGPR